MVFIFSFRCKPMVNILFGLSIMSFLSAYSLHFKGWVDDFDAIFTKEKQSWWSCINTMFSDKNEEGRLHHITNISFTCFRFYIEGIESLFHRMNYFLNNMYNLGLDIMPLLNTYFCQYFMKCCNFVLTLCTEIIYILSVFIFDCLNNLIYSEIKVWFYGIFVALCMIVLFVIFKKKTHNGKYIDSSNHNGDNNSSNHNGDNNSSNHNGDNNSSNHNGDICHRKSSRHYKSFRVIPLLMVALFVISILWESIHLYQITHAKNSAILFKGIPPECVPENMTLWQSIKAWWAWHFSWNPAPCEEYHKALLVNPLWEINPLLAITSTVTRCFSKFVHICAEGFGSSIQVIFRHIPSPWQPVIMAAGFIVIILFLIVAFKYRISFPFWFKVEPSNCNCRNDMEAKQLQRPIEIVEYKCPEVCFISNKRKLYKNDKISRRYDSCLSDNDFSTLGDNSLTYDDSDYLEDFVRDSRY